MKYFCILLIAPQERVRL